MDFLIFAGTPLLIFLIGKRYGLITAGIVGIIATIPICFYYQAWNIHPLIFWLVLYIAAISILNAILVRSGAIEVAHYHLIRKFPAPEKHVFFAMAYLYLITTFTGNGYLVYSAFPSIYQIYNQPLQKPDLANKFYALSLPAQAGALTSPMSILPLSLVSTILASERPFLPSMYLAFCGTIIFFTIMFSLAEIKPRVNEPMVVLDPIFIHLETNPLSHRTSDQRYRSKNANWVLITYCFGTIATLTITIQAYLNPITVYNTTITPLTAATLATLALTLLLGLVSQVSVTSLHKSPVAKLGLSSFFGTLAFTTVPNAIIVKNFDSIYESLHSVLYASFVTPLGPLIWFFLLPGILGEWLASL
ncbi:anaerobic C4-dicarboxylate transporter family protein [Corynebacterium freiburgense]|uniref:anaerobic C4-dicarboxylate transporter family protein n=1 Tax=Corynebacterium freiburgense TaxID=556548 RepID=UPI0004167A42|nr:anaerobic C4-dicarboxylate transporter family protein [Corynebacterium freiburgense]WJZ01894.1 anaerobic C4-dicarboxylate transporter [Corynebacterium freiburgense]